MDDVKITVKKENESISIHVDNLDFSFKTDHRNLRKYVNTKRLNKKLNKLSKLADCYIEQGSEKEYEKVRKEAVKLAINHNLGVFSFDRLYKKYKDLATVESIVKAVNEAIADIL